MTIKFTKYLPYLLSYTDEMGIDTGGYVSGLIVRIRPKYKDDKGIHEHECWHIVQRYMTLGFHGLIKKLSKTYATWAEVSAYKKQLRYPPATSNLDYYRQMYAGFIATRYGLGITAGEAVKRLS